jgi:hypothetical protein
MSTFARFLRARLQDEAGAGEGGGEGGAGEGGGGGDFNWREQIPEQYRNEAMFSEEQVKDFPSLIDQFANSQRLLGDSIRIPGENADADTINRFNEKLSKVNGITRIPGMEADEQELKEFYSKLGVPEEPSNYEFYTPADDDIPEGIELDTHLNEPFGQVAHQLNLTPNQVKGISKWFTENSIAEAKSKLDRNNSTVEELKKEYGNDYESRLSLATDVVEKFGTKYALEDLKGEIGNHPGLAMMLADIGLATTENGLQRLDSEGNAITKSTTEINMEIEELMNDPAYADSKADNHGVVVKKVEKLYEQLEVIKKQSKS